MEEEKSSILDIIDGIMDISNYIYNQRLLTTFNGTIIPHPYKKNEDWRSMSEMIDDELRANGLLTDDEKIVIHFDDMGKVNIIEKILDVYEKPLEIEKKFEVDDCEVYIKKNDSFSITPKTAQMYIISQNDWKNYKRTKLMDRMLDEKL